MCLPHVKFCFQLLCHLVHGVRPGCCFYSIQFKCTCIYFLFMMCNNKHPDVMERFCHSCISFRKEEIQLKAIIRLTLIMNFAQTNVNT